MLRIGVKKKKKKKKIGKEKRKKEKKNDDILERFLRFDQHSVSTRENCVRFFEQIQDTAHTDL